MLLFLCPNIASLHHCIIASLHHCIIASLHHCIIASLHHCIIASLEDAAAQEKRGGLKLDDLLCVGLPGWPPAYE
jgi:hypothetical protein